MERCLSYMGVYSLFFVVVFCSCFVCLFFIGMFVCFATVLKHPLSAVLKHVRLSTGGRLHVLVQWNLS